MNPEVEICADREIDVGLHQHPVFTEVQDGARDREDPSIAACAFELEGGGEPCGAPGRDGEKGCNPVVPIRCDRETKYRVGSCLQKADIDQWIEVPLSDNR